MQKKQGIALPVQVIACLVVFSGLAASGSVFAQDSCAEAAGIGMETINGSTTGAPRGGESDCGRSDDSPSHWFRFTSETDSRMLVTTCGSDFDTVLSVYPGCPGDEDNEITCNDDACAAGSRQSEVEFDATAGAEYLIRVAGYRGDTGDYTLDVAEKGDAPEPEPEDCEDVQEVGITDTVEGNTSELKNTGSASCGSSTRSPDAIFRHVATQACLLTLSTCGSDFDTVLSIHSGCPPTQENELACNDDSCGLQSTVGYEVEADESYWIRVSGYNGASGSFTLGLSCAEPPPVGEGADITISSMSNIRQMGRLSDVVAISMQSTICNMGSESVDWYGNPDPRHPFLVFNLYRLQEGRLEQIGQSWVKHGFAASQTTGVCGLTCRRDPDGNLGSGCADIYGVTTNASQRTFGPRHEINPWTGEFIYAGSHIDTTSSNHNPIQHRLTAKDADLDSAANPDARYFVELFTLSHDDTEHTNSLGWQEIDISGSPGGDWDFDFRQVIGNPGPAIDAWEGGNRTVIPEGKLVDDGRCYLDVHVTENADGTYHYEYALFNLDMHRSVSSLSIPVGSDVTVRGIGFSAVESSEDGFNNAPWDGTRDDSGVTWSTSSFASHPDSNPLGWGSLYNFWFDANVAPGDGGATLGVYRTDIEGPASFSGTTRVPGEGVLPPPEGAIFRRGDADGNGSVELTDAILVLDYLFQGSRAPGCLETADSDDNGKVDISDAIRLLGWLFLGGEPLPAPGAQECGRDPTPNDSAECVYDPASC